MVGGGEPVGNSIPFNAPDPSPPTPVPLEEDDDVPTPDPDGPDVPTPVPAVLDEAKMPLFLDDTFNGGGNPVGDATCDIGETPAPNDNTEPFAPAPLLVDLFGPGPRKFGIGACGAWCCCCIACGICGCAKG